MERLHSLRPVEIEQRLLARGVRARLVLSAHGPSLLPVAGVLEVRVGPAILSAPDETIEALARFARAPGDLDAAAILGRLRSAPPEPGSDGEGAFHDLEAIFADINARFFGGRVAAKISWSRGSADRRRHSILFGSYWRPPGESVGQIKIHPALDQEWVPKGFVEFVVHHECLHAVVPTRSVDGRRAFHPPEFRARERAYPEYRRWRQWERENLARFLGKARTHTESRLT
ncbi:MAG TPA: hypothetical protein VFF73_29185 [Planctomycetota bacterium]|nr:hypothetical protein [Planctomycetota bacterium]